MKKDIKKYRVCIHGIKQRGWEKSFTQTKGYVWYVINFMYKI